MTACAPALICAFRYKITESATLSNKRCKVCGSAYMFFDFIEGFAATTFNHIRCQCPRATRRNQSVALRLLVRDELCEQHSSHIEVRLQGLGIGKFSTALLFSIG